MNKSSDFPKYPDISIIYLNCSLKPSHFDKESHTRHLINISKSIADKAGVTTEVVRVADLNIPAGVYEDMVEHGFSSDDWPDLQEKIHQADIVVIATPIWLGQISSIAAKVIERLYAGSSQTNQKGQYKYYGKVGGCLITGNEDGIKHCAMSILYSLQHVGFTIPPQADAGWIGEVGPGPSYGDLKEDAEGNKCGYVGYDNDFTNRNTTFMTWNLLHMARILNDNGGIPNYGNNKSDWHDGERYGFENPEYR